MRQQSRLSVKTRRVLAAILLPLMLVSFVACEVAPEGRTDEPEETATPVVERGVKDSLFLIIDQSGGEADTFDLSFYQEDSMSVFWLLRIVAAQEQIAFKSKEYPMGVLVEQIGERVNGQGGFWLYTINSQAVPRAVSAHYPAAGDTIRFFYELR